MLSKKKEMNNNKENDDGVVSVSDKTAETSNGGCDLRLLEAVDCYREDTKSRDRSCSEDRRSKTNRTR